MILWLLVIHRNFYIKDGQIAETIERKDLTQKEYFYKIVDVNSTESQKLFID